ncbi:PP2C family protein-serine/threonine phosphatase [Streptomyces sp. NBC_01190]|uniref:PP2C family protein-serine/threonine phosphatase n=1 Tax=Streptomyces sp. NBC_01190 TaxID=2903767 RepID=UPI003862D813|nr:serine/threonine-protein phosphatase [Streptomyces sp. NBC_01190]
MPDRIDERLLESLLAQAHAAAPGELPSAVQRCATELGLGRIVVYLVDLQQRRLQPMVPSDDDTPELTVDDSYAGSAYRTLTLYVEETGDPLNAGNAGNPSDAGAGGEDALTAWLPLVDGADRLGVLGARTTGLDAALLRRLRAFALVLSMVIASKRAHGDSLTRLTRSQPMELPAEMLRAFLPPRTIGNADVVSTAVLEPAYELGGDAFDHSLAGGRLHAAIFDAMGHDLAAGLTTAVALAGDRNARRNGADLMDIMGIIDEALDRWLPDQFCTAVFAELDLDTGRLRWCNCGHPPPLLIRDGRLVPGALERVAQLPLGSPSRLLAEPRVVHETVLRPGDRVLLHTDGVPEARMRDGTQFGMERFTGAILRAAIGELAPEVLRRLIHEIVGGQDSRLRDDATILLLEWKPAEPHRADPVRRPVG